MKHTSPIYSIPLTDITTEAPKPNKPDDLFCSFCWKYHPKDTTGRYEKHGLWACASCVLDVYNMGALLGKSWQETKSFLGISKGEIK